MNTKCMKMGFDTKSDALVEIKRQKAHNIRFKKSVCHKVNLKLRPYLCPFCNKWHLTSQKKRKKYK